MLKRLLFLFLFFPLSFFVRGQCMTVPETLENLVAASPLVVEGKVRSQQSFWDTDNKNIYTVNEIEVFKVFQGLTTTSTVHVVTRGGVVGLEMDRISNALELEIGEMGLFMLQNFSGNLAIGGSLHSPTEGVLGFIRYDLVIGKAQGVFDSYADISIELYSSLTDITGLPIANLGLWDTEDAGLSGDPSVERAIVSEQEGTSNANFEVHAGIGNLLTITGTDFGTAQGSVLFPDANSGGSRYISTLPHQITEWSDTQIVLEVPYRAGTGKVRIDKADGESLIGAEALPIGYDHINVQYTDNNGRKAYETQLTSDNGNGGYDFQFEADFADNIGASQAFTSLIETWACATGVNFQIGAVTDVDEDANDGINIVRFDNGDELGGRTLAYARSRYRGCYQGDTIKWYVNEIEVVVNDDYDWYYGDGFPGASQFDFETVMLHEIGHTQQLGHVINANEVMHFAVGPGQQKRALSHIDTIGGEFVTAKSTDESVCGRDLMEHFGSCCEAMAITEQPSDYTLCSDDTTATFAFGVDFATIWKWQVKIGEDWIDLTDDMMYSGVLTENLTVMRSDNDSELREFRCVAGNACDESVISETARLSVPDMSFSMTKLPATCDAEGKIQLDRNTTEGAFRVSTNGGTSYDTLWPANESQINIVVLSGSYVVVLLDDITGCSLNLGSVEINDPVVLEVSVEAIQKTDCSNENGSIRLDFNTHPDFDRVEISLDGGSTYSYSFDTTSEENNITGLSADTYTIVARWVGSACNIPVGEYTIEKENSEGGDCSDTMNEASDTKNPEIPETPETPDVSETPESPDISETPETSETRDTDKENKNPEVTVADESTDISIKIYPNPTQERVYIKSGSSEIIGLQLFGTGGNLMQSAIPQKENKNTYYFDIAHAQAGVYSLQIITLKGSVLKRVVIK